MLPHWLAHHSRPSPAASHTYSLAQQQLVRSLQSPACLQHRLQPAKVSAKSRSDSRRSLLLQPCCATPQPEGQQGQVQHSETLSGSATQQAPGWQSSGIDSSSTSAIQRRTRPWQQVWWSRVVAKVPLLGSRELMLRIAGTLGLLTFIRLGLFIALPGLIPELDMQQAARTLRSQEVFTLESSVPFNIFSLGIGPTINAGLLLTLWQSLWFLPGYEYFQQLRQQGREGSAVMRMYVQQLGLLFAIIMGAYEATRLQAVKLCTEGIGFGAKYARFMSVTDTAMTLVAGAVLIRWLSDHLEPWGLGEGLSLIICSAITSRYLRAVPSILSKLASTRVPQWKLAAAALATTGIIFAGLFLSQVERRYPIVHYRNRIFASPSHVAEARDAMLQQLARKAPNRATSKLLPRDPTSPVSAPSDYLPLRITPSGMSPLLMASFYLAVLPQLLSKLFGLLGLRAAGQAVQVVHHPVLEPFALALTVFLMNLVQLQSGTKEVADYLASSEVGLKGVVPGAATARFLDRQQALMRLIGSVVLAGMTLTTHFVDHLCAVQLGVSLGCINLLLIASYMASAQRQVSALLGLPQTQLALQREQNLLLQC